MADYCTPDELKEWLGSTSGNNPAIFAQVIIAASRGIDQYCQRTFGQDGTLASPVARHFEPPTDLRTLRLGDFNDLAESAITLKTDEGGDGTFETTWASTDYELLPLNPAGAPETRPYTTVRATGTGRWFPTPSCSGRSARIEITGVWGWPAVPADVKQACLIQSARLYKRKESPEGVAGFGEFGVVRVTRIDPDVQALLDPYRRSAVLVA